MDVTAQWALQIALRYSFFSHPHNFAKVHIYYVHVRYHFEWSLVSTAHTSLNGLFQVIVEMLSYCTTPRKCKAALAASWHCVCAVQYFILWSMDSGGRKRYNNCAAPLHEAVLSHSLWHPCRIMYNKTRAVMLVWTTVNVEFSWPASVVLL